ncbi:hypothetical protein J4409_00045 [Candidatus Woesearchaeota archaeon]|nr:hypothetical protein [Candidatus Woesearchaeota archaeon]
MKKIYHLLAFLLLISIMSYSYLEHDKYYLSISDFIKAPEKYDNVLTEQQVKIESITKDSFTARFGNDYITVKYPNMQKPKNGMVTFTGYYKKEGYIEAKEIRYNNYSDGKYLFSFIGLFLFLFFLFKEWKLTPRGFENA